MKPTAFERFLPWTGLVAGLLWAAQATVGGSPEDAMGDGTAFILGDASGGTTVAGFLLIAGSLAMTFFAAAVGRALRGPESGATGYSTVAFGGLLVAATGMGGLGAITLALGDAAAAGDTGSASTLLRLSGAAWLPILAGLIAAFVAVGVGGLRSAAVPRWFAVVTVLLAGLGLLGPLAAAVYLALPVWLAGAAIVLGLGSRRRAPSSADAPRSSDDAAQGTAVT